MSSLLTEHGDVRLWLKALNTSKIILIEITKGANTYYVSNQAYTPRAYIDTIEYAPHDVDGPVYNPILELNGIPRFKRSISDFSKGGTQQIGRMSLATWRYLKNGDEIDLRTLDLRGASVNVRMTGPPHLFVFNDYPAYGTSQYNEPIQLFTGKIIGQGADDDRSIWFELSSVSRDLEGLQVPVNRYSGLLTPLEGMVKPFCLGPVAPAKVALIDSSTLTYQVHDGSLDNISVIENGDTLYLAGTVTASGANWIELSVGSSIDNYYNGCEIFISSVGTKIVLGYVGSSRRITVSTFAVVPPAGSSFALYLYVKNLSAGTFRLLSQPVGQINAYAFKADLSAGAAITLLAKTFGGFVDADLDISIDAMASSSSVSIQLTSTSSLADLLTQICAGYCAYWYIGSSGKLVVRSIKVPGPSGTELPGEYLLEHFSWRKESKIYYKYTARYAHRQQISSPAITLAESTRELLKQAYSVTSIEDSAIKTAYPDAEEFFIDVPDSYVAAVIEVLNRYKALYGVARETGTAVVPFPYHAADIGGEQAFAASAGYAAGNWIVRGSEIRFDKHPSAKLELWR